ncbi:RES family NAD+ phosphorylase [Lonepinella sp. BR2904]|uniref:RES family NAD+ phosphorylase n=1 Tax=Lonepinella sp. BR2904 TaxID=3434551 RepID=UPI003F6DB413
MSKPRRYYSELDYLPTQYVSEWIKSMGYDGIEFRSSLHKNGMNLTIFNPSKFLALDVAVYDIRDSQFQYKKLS